MIVIGVAGFGYQSTGDRALLRNLLGMARWIAGSWRLCAGISLFVAALAVSWAAMLIGVDFGMHWDEQYQYGFLVNTISTGIIMPAQYNYPGMTYLLSIVAMLHRVLASLGQAPPADLTLEAFSAAARPLFCAVSASGGLWLFLGLWRRNEPRAVLAGGLAAAFYLSSFELSYHARWVAPDALTAAFTALFLMCLWQAERARGHGWLFAAAVAAGLATSSKYTAGALVPALLLYTLLHAGRQSEDAGWVRHGGRLALLLTQLGLVSLGVFALVTPGVLLEPLAFYNGVTIEAQHYATGHVEVYGTRPYDVADAADYARRLAAYLVLVLLSSQPVLAATTAAAALVGLAVMLRRSWRLGVVTVGLTGFYAAFFSQEKVFIVRNFLLFLPIMALLAGIGAEAVLDAALALRPRRLRTAAVAVIVAWALGVVGWNGWVETSAAESIVASKPAPARYLEQHLARYLAEHPRVRVAVSTDVQAELAEAGEPASAQIVDPAHADRYLFLFSELGSTTHLRAWPASEYGIYRWIGPEDVNFNYYPTWIGSNRIIILDIKAARAMGVVDALSAGKD